MEERKFLSNVAFIQGLNIAVKAIWILLIDRAVQNTLSESAYGEYFFLYSTTVLFIIVLDLGLNTMNSRELAVDKTYINRFFTTFITTKLLLSVCFFIGLTLTGYILDFTETQWQLSRLLMVMQIAISFNAYFRSNLAALHRFKLDGILAVTDRILVIIVCGSWFVVPGWISYLTIQNFVAIQVVGTLFTLVFALLLNLRELSNPSLQIRFKEVFRLIRSALPFALLATLMAGFTRIDAVMLQQMSGSVASDQYAMGYRLLDAGNMVAVLLSGMLLPMFSRFLGQGKLKELSGIVGASVKFLVFPSILVASIAVYFPMEVMEMMYPNKIDVIQVNTFRFLMVSFVFTTLIYVYGTLLTADKKLKWLNFLAFFTLISNISLNAYLIPKYGSDGAALATLITQSAFALTCLFKSKYEYKLLVNKSLVAKLAVYILGLNIIFGVGKQFFESAIVPISIGVVFAGFFVVVAGIFTPDLLKIVERRKA